jgi:branched-subunit amino acid aminotransferase/4-amino-4-deoxychorismate lyase
MDADAPADPAETLATLRSHRSVLATAMAYRGTRVRLLEAHVARLEAECERLRAEAAKAKEGDSVG